MIGLGIGISFSTTLGVGGAVDAPTNTVIPMVSGTAKAGNVLTTSTGTWTGAGIAFTYQWLKDGVAISGATADNYTVLQADLGAMISCQVTATNGSGSAVATSAEVGPVLTGIPQNSSLPVISGTIQVGHTISTSDGVWTNTPSSYTYQWKAAGVNISGATSNTYLLTTSEYNKAITCVVTAINVHGSNTATSGATSAVLPAIPVNTVAPALSGTQKVGQTLSCSTGTWTGQGTISYVYQWKRDGVNISGATSSTYVLTTSDYSTIISCLVTASNSGGGASQASNSSSGIVSANAINTVAPAITGTVQVGQTLSVSDGTWTSQGTLSYTYQWKADGVAISGATNNTYLLTTSEYNTAITCVVTATNDGGSTNQVSNTTSAVLPIAPTNTVAPAITGTQTVGQVLTVSNGTWSSQATPTYTYQWKRDGSNISAATSNTYTLVSADEGTIITCSVTATNSGGATSQISNSTSAILPNVVPANTVAPVISGTPLNAGTLFTTTNGTWSHSPTSYAYQWKRDGVSISGATSSTYTTVEADVTTTLTCVVTASNAIGAGTGAASNGLAIAAKSVPTFVAVGTRGVGVANVTPTIPIGSQANDILILFVETANETVAAPSGWTEILNSPQGTGTAGAVGSIRLTAFWKRHSGTESDPVITDPGDHANAEIIAIRGCVTSGNPWSDIAGSTEATIDNSFSGSGPTTVLHNELVLICIAVGIDVGTSRWNTSNNMACASLSSITNRDDQCTSSGNGGGLAMWTATMATPGAVGTLTATANSSTEKAWLIIGLKPN